MLPSFGNSLQEGVGREVGQELTFIQLHFVYLSEAQLNGGARDAVLANVLPFRGLHTSTPSVMLDWKHCSNARLAVWGLRDHRCRQLTSS
jgi:hypothetical protein